MIHHDDQLRREGNLNAIMKGFVSKSPLNRLQAICGAVNHSVFNDAVKTQLIRLKDDPDVVMGYSISQLAIAALHKFNVIEYTGNDETVKMLVNTKIWFDRE